MGKFDNIYDKIQELLGCIPGNVSIMEQQIDADIQTEYFRYARNLKETLSREEILKNRDNIFEPGMTLEDKKLIMVQLAGIDSIDAYRTLEKYTHGDEILLKDWAVLALQECRLLLESRLLDESQILISTGLGGKGLKLRYFTVLVSSSGMNMTVFQQKIVEKETAFTIRKHGGEVEKIVFDKELCSILSIIPIQKPVQMLFDDLISECNQYGNFLNSNYIITNVRIIATEDIRKMLKAGKNKARKS